MHSRADFLIHMNDFTREAPVLQVEIYDPYNNVTMESRTILPSDFSRRNSSRTFSLFFKNVHKQTLLFRLFYYCCAKVTHLSTELSLLDEGKLGPFWHKKATIKLISETAFPYNFTGGFMGNTGTYIRVLDDIWYTFYRHERFAPSPKYCSLPFGLTRLEVRSSRNQGKTWSDPVTIAAPVPNSPSECILMDGGAFFDEETQTWHYLSQCLGRDSHWNLCHYSRSGRNPMGPFVANPKNPVVIGGQLWSKICSGTGKHCPPGTIDEGTPDVVEKRSGFFVVTFHGYDYNANRGSRGISLTRYFVTFTLSGYDLPYDAIFSKLDCDKWNITWIKVLAA
jgi:hypothetical protein